MSAESDPAWLKWAKELQFIAQAGATYCKDPYDMERFERIREMAAEMMAQGTGLPVQKVRDLFCSETGYQTPKLDTRAAIFSDDGEKILLVQERNGIWSLPGGWVDVLETIKSNTEKEVFEEAGLQVKAEQLLALLDRNSHNQPPYAYNIAKAFVLCRLIGGEFTPNHETIATAYFGRDELPECAADKTTQAQVLLCFDAYEQIKAGKPWSPPFD